MDWTLQFSQLNSSSVDQAGGKGASLGEMEDMEKGEILVTPTTDPEFLPAMKKAAAFVTDIGGLLSHTAIVARELHVDCVVAAADASRIFKTGDMVEVDATKGTITKLS